MAHHHCRCPGTVLLLIGLAALPLGAQSARLDRAAIEALAARAVEQFRPIGLALAVVQDDDAPVELAYGVCRQGVPLSSRSVFNIASCTKAFTAALLAQQVEQGRLGWDDRVVAHLPEFRLADPWLTAHLTVRDLLSHRSGLATFAGDLLWYGADRTDAEVLARLERLPITQEFRSQFGYQNLMYLVAGMLLERITGESWEDLVEQRLLQPLGMAESRACLQRLPADAERALPHIDGEEVPDHEFVACKPAASICASVHDLVPWLRMLLHDGRHGDQILLASASLRELWRPHVSIGRGSGASTDDFRSYGLGWFLQVEAGDKVVEHDGGMPGFLSKITLVPAARFGFVVLNNGNDGVLNEALKQALLLARTGGDAAGSIDRMAAVRDRLRQREQAAAHEREAARQPGTRPSLPLEAYAGRYEDRVYGPAEVRLVAGQLHVEVLPSRSRLCGTLRHWHHDTFRVDFADRFLPFALVRFVLDHTGRIEGFRIDCPSADFDFGALDFRRAAAAAGPR